MIVLDISNPKNTQLIAADGTETGLSVQDLINALCNVLDGTQDHDLADMVGEDEAEKVTAVREAVKGHWTYDDGRKVVG